MTDPPERAKGHRSCPTCGGPQQLTAKKVGGHLVWAFVCRGCGRVDEPPERSDGSWASSPTPPPRG